ncbi:D-proline dehydrogenase [Pyrobaculum aerophilum]|uniref:Conserved within P. aerophilum n=2 Tax=Pyrobaculum aerophilum TaxID=13773 RepID=Q8ZVW3_PYRAE|nr:MULTISPECIES: D-proline dehydrogenase [Pyrobaculum]AAL63941.1 conserved within P. aerophilum [Pyrobaculum aerophilum str. IM2]MCX8137522.1 D-proline dehydrogenase [Pyrobaculum aerophilum]HII46497.1 FAD-binding oxidoreductase [Pyrobaculum aerophilum]
MIIVVGGGIVGLFTAFFLKKEGADVVIIEQGRPGDWSRAAAGILEFTRFVINRINVRAYPRRYISMMLRGDARVKTWDWGWISTYLRVWGKEPSQEMWEAVRALGDFSRRQYRALAEERNDFDYAEEPLYEIGIDVGKALEEAKRDPLSPKVEAGTCCGREALAYLDAAKLSTDAFIERMLKELEGVEVVNKRVEEVAGREVWLEGGGVIHGDGVVVAAGYWARRLGIPVAPFKGYGFRTNAKADKMFVEMAKGVAVVPLSKWTKVTGRFDLDGTSDHGPSQRVLQRAREVLGDFNVIDMAVGYRPCTPDGFPVVDRIGSVVVVTGACRLGWTYGPALGKLAADLALGRRGVDALSASRFRR